MTSLMTASRNNLCR